MIGAFLANITNDITDWVIRLLYFWLAEGPKQYWRTVFGLSKTFEDGWATRIMLRNLFSPLFQDYSIAGRILGPIFRLGRFFIGIGVHLLLLLIYAVVFIFLCLVFWGAPLFFIINLFIWNQ